MKVVYLMKNKKADRLKIIEAYYKPTDLDKLVAEKSLKPDQMISFVSL